MSSRSLNPAIHTVVGSSHHCRIDNRGFALVVTVSLLILLTAIALGFLSLSAVTLRTNSQDQALMRARANARLALQIAIGELQRNAGPDMRVTASADILDASSPSNLAVTGVWKSWEGSDHEATGPAAARPIAPNYDSKRQPASSANGRFLSWLVSNPQKMSEGNLISDDPGWSVSTALQQIVRNVPFEGAIPLVSTGSLAADDPRQVHVVPVAVNDGGNQRGSYAWWVAGENRKARLPVPYKPANNNDAAAWSVMAKSHDTADPSALDLDAVLAADGAAKATNALSLKTASLLVPPDPNIPDPAKQFHDLSASSVGLLTNTATGGWRKDLSLFTENWDLLPDAGAEVFRIGTSASASAIATMTKPKRTTLYSEITPAGSVFYPWSRHRVPPVSDQMRQRAWTAAVTSWHHLKDFSMLYKNIELQSGKPVMVSRLTWGRYINSGDVCFNWTAALNGNGITLHDATFDYLHKVRVVPVLARTQIVFSLRSLPITNSADPNFGRYRVQIGTTPVSTMWNPYNVTLKSTPQWINYVQSSPPAFRFQIGGQTTDYHFMSGQADENSNYQAGGAYPRGYWVPTDNSRDSRIHCNPAANPWGHRDPLYFQLLKPGVTKIFTANSANNVGYNPTATTFGNIRRRLAERGTSYEDMAFDAGDAVRVDARFDSFGIRHGTNPRLVGCYLDLKTPTRSGQNHLEPKLLKTRIGYTDAVANTLWPPLGQNAFPHYTVAELVAPPEAPLVSKPFMSMMFGSRLASDTHLPLKGFLQSDPLLSQLETGDYGLQQQHGQLLYGSTRGIVNPVNAGFDFSFVPHAGAIDSRLPNASADGENRGYIITGVQSGDGLSRIATVELPLRPLTSLAELQHWGLRVDNNVAPYQSHIVANSDAQPLFAPDAVAGSNAASFPAHNLQHDDSYCANHLLFDDWFFSTIAPQPTTFGPTGKTLQETFTAFVRDGAPLDNRAYRSILEDSGISDAEANQLYTAKVNTADAYRRIASRLEVDGMFNVNSTSVKAWRALLGHARNQRVPYYNNNGDIVLSDSTDFATSRTSVASDVAAGATGSSGIFAGASEYSGYRVFTEEMLDHLAEEMVRQVRLRGPFLSLSEFVNRQLSNNVSDNLALAGAVQSTLNVLAANANASANPYSALQADSLNAGLSMLVAQGKEAGSDFTYFPEASEGKSAYGMPGWPRQADILRPLAPILSARDDTFTIRVYGDARDANGNIIARAWCEAIVRRGRDFVSSTEDAADITGPPTALANQKFGRRIQIISFRWLHADEI
jgi:hypothetical protein